MWGAKEEDVQRCCHGDRKHLQVTGSLCCLMQQVVSVEHGVWRLVSNAYGSLRYVQGLEDEEDAQFWMQYWPTTNGLKSGP